LFRKKILLIAVFGTLLAVLWQELNQYYLNYSFPSSNGLITCADEASYLRPPQNFLLKNTWKDNSEGITSYFLRPPGYGIYFLSLKLLFGSKVWLAMKLIQITFYFLSIILISKSLSLYNFNEKSNLIFTSIYAFIPCFSGFMYFTITESITPFFLILSTYSFLRLLKNENEKALFFSLSSAFLILIRPQLLIFILLFLFALFIKKRNKQFLFGLCAFLPFILWNIRTITIAKEWMGIHPIYSNTNNSLYRPSHEKMTNLFRIWEHDGEIFHTTIGVLAYDTNSNYLQKALENVPEKFHSQVKPIFINFHQLKQYQHRISNGDLKRGEFLGEKEFYIKIDELTKQLKSENKMEYYFITPFKSLKKLLLSSHLNLYLFQGPFRGNVFMEILRYFCVLLLNLTYLFSFLLLFSRKFEIQKLISFGIILSLFYLSYIQRLNEERYLTPVIPIAFLMFALYIKTKSDDKDTLFGKFSSLLRK
jgi:hypothetical protein